MAGEWADCTLGDVLTLQRGFDLPAQERRSGTHPIIASTGEVGTHAEAMVKAPGVVIGRSGSLGGGQYVTHDFWPLNTTLWVKDFKGNDIRFCYYLLKSIDFSKFNVGGAVPTLNRNHIHPLPVRVPCDIDEQRAIAHILGTLDDKIELNRRMSETLEGIARAIFKSWFVDFDPVRAKASGEPPESICRRLHLAPDLLALFPDRLVDSELGEIPEGWEVGTIADHCHLNAKSWTAKTLPEVVHYVDLANAKNGVISEIQEFPASAAPSRARRVVYAGDTIVGTVRPGNRSFALIGQSDPKLTVSTGFAVLTPKRLELREFVYYTATSEDNIDRLSRLADGAAYPAVRPEIVTAGVCVFPRSDVVDAFHEAVVAMVDYQIVNSVGNNILENTRDTLLPKLLSGELRVPVQGAA